MVAMVGIDDRTRIASPHRQPDAHEWISACLCIRRCGIRVSGWLPQGPRPYRPSGPILPAKTCVHLCKSATRRRGLTQGCGSVPGRTRAPQGRAPVPNAPCPKPEACPAARPHVGLGLAAPPAIEGGCVASVGRGGAMRGCSVWPTREGKARPQGRARGEPAAQVPGLCRNPWQ